MTRTVSALPNGLNVNDVLKLNERGKNRKTQAGEQAMAKRKKSNKMCIYISMYNTNTTRVAIYELVLSVDTLGNAAMRRAGAHTAHVGKR